MRSTCENVSVDAVAAIGLVFFSFGFLIRHCHLLSVISHFVCVAVVISSRILELDRLFRNKRGRVQGFCCCCCCCCCCCWLVHFDFFGIFCWCFRFFFCLHPSFRPLRRGVPGLVDQSRRRRRRREGGGRAKATSSASRGAGRLMANSTVIDHRATPFPQQIIIKKKNPNRPRPPTHPIHPTHTPTHTQTELGAIPFVSLWRSAVYDWMRFFCVFFLRWSFAIRIVVVIENRLRFSFRSTTA